MDLDAQARITDSFLLSSGLEWMHSRFTSFPQAQLSTPLPAGGALLYSGLATGNQLPFAPKFTFTLSADYYLNLPIGTLAFDLTNYLNSGYPTEADNYLRQTQYDLLGSSVKWSSPDDKYTLRLWGTNLLDKAIYSQAVTQSVGYLAAYQAPRLYRETFSVEFD